MQEKEEGEVEGDEEEEMEEGEEGDAQEEEPQAEEGSPAAAALVPFDPGEIVFPAAIGGDHSSGADPETLRLSLAHMLGLGHEALEVRFGAEGVLHVRPLPVPPSVGLGPQTAAPLLCPLLREDRGETLALPRRRGRSSWRQAAATLQPPPQPSATLLRLGMGRNQFFFRVPDGPAREAWALERKLVEELAAKAATNAPTNTSTIAGWNRQKHHGSR